MGQIYKHTSPSGKCYIGQTTRTWEWRASADPIKGYHSSTKFKNAIRKYGWENFTHEILEDGIVDLDELNIREKFWIEHFDSVRTGYNSLNGATGISYPAKGEIPEKLRGLSKAELEVLYVVEGYSAREIGEMFDSNHNSVIAALQIHKIPRRPLGSPGKRERELSLARAAKRIDCFSCGESFSPSKKTTKTCSRSCAGKFASLNRTKTELPLQAPTILSEEQRENHIRSMKGNSNAVGNKGWIVAGHKRWHVKRNIVNPDCSLCAPDESLLKIS